MVFVATDQLVPAEQATDVMNLHFIYFGEFKVEQVQHINRQISQEDVAQE